MEIWYQIKTENGWECVDRDTFDNFLGEKRFYGPTYGTIMLQKILQPLRWW